MEKLINLVKNEFEKEFGIFIEDDNTKLHLVGRLCNRAFIVFEVAQEHLVSYLALNDADLSKISRKTTSIAMLPQCAVTKKWLFDFDYDSEEQVLEFIEDIRDADPTVEVKYKKTVHGYAVITSHDFDTRALLAKWFDCENKKDGMLLADWKVK